MRLTDRLFDDHIDPPAYGTNDKDVMLKLVEENGEYLQYASDELKDDIDVVSVAINECPVALQWASRRLQNDYDLALDVIENNPFALFGMPPNMQDKLVYTAVNRLSSFVDDVAKITSHKHEYGALAPDDVFRRFIAGFAVYKGDVKNDPHAVINLTEQLLKIPHSKDDMHEIIHALIGHINPKWKQWVYEQLVGIDNRFLQSIINEIYYFNEDISINKLVDVAQKSGDDGIGDVSLYRLTNNPTVLPKSLRPTQPIKKDDPLYDSIYGGNNLLNYMSRFQFKTINFNDFKKITVGWYQGEYIARRFEAEYRQVPQHILSDLQIYNKQMAAILQNAVISVLYRHAQFNTLTTGDEAMQELKRVYTTLQTANPDFITVHNALHSVHHNGSVLEDVIHGNSIDINYLLAQLSNGRFDEQFEEAYQIEKKRIDSGIMRPEMVNPATNPLMVPKKIIQDITRPLIRGDEGVDPIWYGDVKPGVTAKKRKASVLDRPAEALSPLLFDDDAKIRPSVRNVLMKRFLDKCKSAGFVSPESWLHFYLVGSSATYQWVEESDIDVTVFVDKSKISKNEYGMLPDEIIDKLTELAKKINGQPLSDGVISPVNYYVREDMNISSDAIYDLTENEWIMQPEKIDDYDPQRYWQVVWDEARQIAQGWDIETGQLRRDVIDLGILKRDMARLSNKDITSLKFKAIAQEGKVIAEILDLIKDYNDLHDQRVRILSMADEDTPNDVIRDFKSWVPVNVLYKILERYSYVQFLKDLKYISQERGIDDDVLGEIHNMLNFGRKHANEQDNARKDVRKYLYNLYGRDNKVYSVYIKQLTKRFKK